MKDDTLKERRERFEQALVRKVRRARDPMDAALYYAARARKGFTVEILRQILNDRDLLPEPFDLTVEEAQVLFARELPKLSFVKRPHGAREGWYFLHDEMYDLIDRYVWHVDYPGYTHQAETARFLAEQIYGDEDGEDEQLIAKASKKVDRANLHAELIEARRELDILKTEQLFYRLEAAPAEGYQVYRRLSLQAISYGNREWDDMLRVEFLRFLHTFPYWAKQHRLIKEIDLESDTMVWADTVKQDADSAWVQRRFARGDYKNADKDAQDLLARYPHWGDFWKASIGVGRGAALVRLGRDEAEEVLGAALKILKAGGLKVDFLDDPVDLADKPDLNWIVQYYIGSAYLYLGLRARDRWDLERAVDMYKSARLAFVRGGEEISAARARNNSAYILVKQGRYHDAIGAAREAIEIRDRHGDVVGKGLSLNTLAIAVDRAGNKVNAASLAWDALELLQMAKESGYPGLDRPIAMVYINLGRIERHRARQERPQLAARVMRYWQRAEGYLKQAGALALTDDLAPKDVLEPYYVFELYNQFGLLYSGWGNWSVTHNLPKDFYSKYFEHMREGSEYFERADEYAQRHELSLERADNLEDWAWVFHLRLAYREQKGDPMTEEELRDHVTDRLDQAEPLLRKALAGSEPRKGLQAYYILGSVHHQRGRFLHKFDQDIEGAMQRYALSIACYNQFVLSSLDPLERRERIYEHVRNTLEGILREDSGEWAEQICASMVEAVDQAGLPSEELARRLDRILKVLSAK